MIYIFKGDDTVFATVNRFITFTLATDLDLTGWKAVFKLQSFVQEFEDITSKQFDVELTHEDTMNLRFGDCYGVLTLTDADGRIKTITNTLPFFVTTKVIENEPQVIDLDIPECAGIDITARVGSAYVTQQELQAGLATKQPVGDYALNSSVNLKADKSYVDIELGKKANSTDIPDISNLATKTQLNDKVDKVSGKGLSTNDFTAQLKSKLETVDENAKVHSVNGQTGIVTIDVPDVSSLVPKEVEDTTSTAITIDNAVANTTYKYGTINSLTLTNIEDSPMPITVIFTASSDTPTINLPSSLESINISDGFEADKKYVLAIKNNIAVMGSIE